MEKNLRKHVRKRRSKTPLHLLGCAAVADGRPIPVGGSSASNYAAFFALSFNSPNRTKLSAVATTASSFERGAQPNIRLAFSLVAFFLFPSSGRISFIAGSRIAAHPVWQFPRRYPFCQHAHAALQHLGDIKHRHEIAGRPLAAGCVIARICRSATSRTSTAPKHS